MFLNDDFLLTTETAKTLFHDYASAMPIIDYHCHLDPKEIYEDKNFKNITEAWLYGDHYKWRLMRANGVDEKYITGDASDYDKFLAWSKTLPKAIGNPVYAWAHLELKRFFGIDLFINEENAPEIWERANAKLAQENFSRRGLIRSSNVKVVCTTDDPIDDLKYHDLIREDEKDFKVFPAFRPDKALNIEATSFAPWFKSLEAIAGKISTFSQYIVALEARVDYFHQRDCRVSDHALDSFVFESATEAELDAIFAKAIGNQVLTQSDINKHKTAVLLKLFEFYAKRGWVSQLHLKAFRNNNEAMFNTLGPDTGFDAVNDEPIIGAIQKLMDATNAVQNLPKTILYSLNPADYLPLLTLMQCFQGEAANKIQMGSGWWFNDTREGMRDQLTQFANQSVLGNFVGMLTDSRSFLSYPRHEYFRRVLCELLGEWVERGEAPVDMEYLGSIVKDISYNNANAYFGFNKYF
jgi:glucuronate isomerase